MSIIVSLLALSDSEGLDSSNMVKYGYRCNRFALDE